MGEKLDPERLEALRRQEEKMAALGKLTAGLAHELNNPVAAANRAAGVLRENVQDLSSFMWKMPGLGLTADQARSLADLQCRLFERNTPLSAEDILARSDQEEVLAQWLEAHQVKDAWDLSASLARAGLDLAWLDQVAEIVSGEALSDVLAWFGRNAAVNDLLVEIEQSSQRVSGLVKAVRSFTYMNQAPVEVDIVEGLENTLVILAYKLKGGVKVVREYTPDLPPVPAYPGELNQVWMNLIVNAIDALGDSGTIWIRTAREEQAVMVEISDNGPGIPVEAQGHIFEPFFTTKEPGKGTGLGLDISYRIITERHHGELRVESRPGETRFQVRLPVTGPGGESG